MTTRQFQIVFYTIIGFCTLTIVLSYILFDYMEAGTAMDWSIKYFALPLFIVMLPSCSFIYIRFSRPFEKKKYNSKLRVQLRTVFRISIFTLSMTLFFVGTTFSLIILTNAYSGESRAIHLNAKVVGYYTLRNKGRKRHYIKIQDQQIDRIIELKVQDSYEIGQTFNKTMKIGKWGLIYSEQ